MDLCYGEAPHILCGLNENAEQNRTCKQCFKLQKDFQHFPTHEIVEMILNIDHLFGKIQLLGILLRRHGEDFMVGDARGKSGTKDLQYQTSVERMVEYQQL